MSTSPTGDDVQRYAARTQFSLTEEEANAFAENFQAQDELLAPLNTLPDRSPPDREYWDPDESETPSTSVRSTPRFVVAVRRRAVRRDPPARSLLTG